MSERQHQARQKTPFEKARKRAVARVQKARIKRTKKLWMVRTRRTEALARAQEMGR